MRETAPFWTIAELVTEKKPPGLFQVSLEDMVPNSGRLVDGELSRYQADGTPFQVGDVLFGKLRPYLAKHWLADRCGTAGGDIHVYRPANYVDPRFLYYVVGSRDFVKYAEAASKGVKMPRVEWMGLREYEVYRPDVVLQEHIAAYLDRETSEIDAMIAKLDMLSATTQSRKISAIGECAGIATATETRPLQWFAELATGSTPKGGGTDENLFATGTIGWITPEDLQATVAPTRFLCEQVLAQMTVVPADSVLVCCIGATVGKLGLASEPVTTNQQITSTIPRDGVDGRYLYYALAAEKEQILANTVTTTLPIINNARLRSLRIRSCDLAAQKRIADHLDEVTRRIDAMLAKVADLKVLLLERRSALITDVVTGRKQIA